MRIGFPCADLCSSQDKTEKTGEVQSTTPLGTPVQGSVRADTSISWSTPDTHSRSPTFRIVSNSQTSDSNIVPDATGFGTVSDPSEPSNYIEGFTGFMGPSNQSDSQLMADYPSHPPSAGLATVLQQLNDDLTASKQKLAMYQGLYDSHDPALSRRSRQSVFKKLQAMGEEIDAKADRIASLYGVLESQGQQNQQMRAARNLTI